MCNNFKEWLRGKNPIKSDMASVGIFLEEVDEIVERTYHKSGIDTGEEVNKLLCHKTFKRDLLKGVMEWLFTYQEEYKSVPYEYTSRDNRRDWEHDKYGWSVAIGMAIREYDDLKEELEAC